ncbi:MAG: alpha-galactosidase [Planctomycetia bacterium]|nr:alpha-galactosidase [Planctomycetia bacterium]
MTWNLKSYRWLVIAGLALLLIGSRGMAAEATAAGKVAAKREGSQIRLANDRVVVELDASDGTWDASWPGGVDAAVQRAKFSASADGKPLPPAPAKTEVEPFTDKLGTGIEVRQTWAHEVGVEVRRCLRVYDGEPTVTISGEITNRAGRNVQLNATRMLEVSEAGKGSWHLGPPAKAPGAVLYPADGTPCRAPSADAAKDVDYSGTGVLAFSTGEPGAAGLALGYVRALDGAPRVTAKFRPGAGGKSLAAETQFGGRLLKPGGTVELGTVWVSARPQSLEVLPRYGDAMAALADQPVRHGANSLWCSWYPIRMGISEEVVFENAAIAAKHFKPLGMDTIQLDHGWQRGDICGDWVGNERFPHGMKWLADELRSRYGLKLGLWIAPTEVAETSEFYKEHRDLLYKDASGKLHGTWKWFWKPNPQMYMLDGSNPEAAKWVEETFARLSAEGACYYKIDFLNGASAGCHDPECVPGWGVYSRLVESIRRGAGPEAWIRYTQAPPLLVVGLANSSHMSPDTGDAGFKATIGINSQLLAASYWANDRIFQRDVCDNSVGMKADLEEARLRLAMMCVGGCSTSYSDDFRLLEPARIRMMQQCLPPGGPTMTPLDLFQGDFPSLWRIHCKTGAGEWDVVGVFNFTEQAGQRTVDLAALGATAEKPVAVFEFWQSKLLGVIPDRLTLDMAPMTSRVLLIRPVAKQPQVIGTDMHVLGGYHELTSVEWNAAKGELRGECRRAPGLEGKVFVNVPEGFRPSADAADFTKVEGNVWAKNIRFAEPDAKWSVRFERTGG